MNLTREVIQQGMDFTVEQINAACTAAGYHGGTYRSAEFVSMAAYAGGVSFAYRVVFRDPGQEEDSSGMIYMSRRNQSIVNPRPQWIFEF